MMVIWDIQYYYYGYHCIINQLKLGKKIKELKGGINNTE